MQNQRPVQMQNQRPVQQPVQMQNQRPVQMLNQQQVQRQNQQPVQPVQMQNQQQVQRPVQQPGQQGQRQIPTYNQSPKITSSELNTTVNAIIKQNITDKKYIDDKYLKYIVPSYYSKPKSFCENSEKCKLTKKELCSAITENFIVRNNIIAAILTTIPYKNWNGEYEGGICFEKIMNITKCNVCVPYDFRELKNQDIESILSKILEKADYLNEAKCRENHGYFLKLTKEEELILLNKIKTISPEELNIHPQIKYNNFFLEFAKKLKNSYFEKMNFLIKILEKIKEMPIINNKELNLLSSETKKHIDEMYTTCHNYYVYAIISLIKADIKEDIVRENKVNTFFTEVLSK